MLLSPLDHAKSDAILDGSSWVGGFNLGDQVSLGVDTGEAHQGRVPYGVNDGFMDLHGLEGSVAGRG